MKWLLLIALATSGHVRITAAWWEAGPASIDPTFKRSIQGWLPQCPAGTDLVRYKPAPACFWGKAPMSRKPTQDDMKCLPIAEATKLPACPVE